MRTLKGIGLLSLDVVALTAVDSDCKNTTPVLVSWTDLGETYQLERSLNNSTWTVLYTGTAVTFNDSTTTNTDQMYYYRVKVLSDTVYSNIGSVQIYEQNKQLGEGECDNYNVAPYYWRTPRRLDCGVTYTYAVDEARCKNNVIECPGTKADEYLSLPPGSGTVSFTKPTPTCADGTSGSLIGLSTNKPSGTVWAGTGWYTLTPLSSSYDPTTVTATFSYTNDGAGSGRYAIFYMNWSWTQMLSA